LKFQYGTKHKISGDQEAESRKLKESMEAANKEQTQRHEQVMKLLETYEQ
jgi:hypothetical protein